MLIRKIALITLLTAVSLSSAAADVCGSPGEKPSVKTVVVKLQSKPTEPAFYYRTKLDYTVFVSQAKMKAFIDALDPSAASLPLMQAIRADMPLHEDRDLFHYNFSDWWRAPTLKSMITIFLRRGDASLVEVGGDSKTTITIVDDRKPRITFTHFYEGKRGENEFFYLRDCIAD